MKRFWIYDYPVGKVGIAEADGKITRVFFANSEAPPREDGFEERESALIKKAARQLDAYFAGKKRAFDLPLAFYGTEFQRAVWDALLTIPYGETRSYGEIAARIGRPKASRAVGMANHRNPIAIICPCHRVIGKDGSLTGFGGGLPAKKFLLELEQGKK